MSPGHRRQTTIIPLLIASAGLVVAVPGAVAEAQIRDANVACVSCLVLQADATKVPPAAASVEHSLQGLSLAIRVDQASSEQVRAATEAATTMGARAGLVLRMNGLPAGELLQHVPFVILEGAPDVGTDAALQVRSAVTSIRAASPDAIIGITDELFSDSPIRLEPLIPYIDFIVRSNTKARGSGIPQWILQRRIENPTVDALIAASLSGDGSQILQELSSIDWNVLARFVSFRASEGETSAPKSLSVGEIVARHQAQRRRQEQIVHTLIAHGRTTVVFEAPGFAAPITITAQTTMYSRPGVKDYELRDVRLNGASIVGGDAKAPPRIPLVEPERVAMAPLILTLSDAYDYELIREERTAATRLYVVGFEPLDAGRSLARGTAWIDARDFSLSRIHFVQTGLRGPIASSEQDEELRQITIGGQSVSVPIRTHVFQMYDGAGHRTPINRELTFDRYDTNPNDFDARVAAAHASSSIMLRDTADGLRYLLRDADRHGGEGTRAIATHAGERIRTAVIGVMDDPGITKPLPFAGLGYVDLNLFGTGAQMSAFFGGTYGQLAWSVPVSDGQRWQLHGRAFAIAARYNDRAFHRGVERYEENIRQQPGHASVGLVRRVSSRVRLRADYELNITGFSRADTTAPAFAVPTAAVVHGFRPALEAERGAWAGRVWWNPARRQRWRSWGNGREYDPDARDFQRYGASVTRTVAVGPRLGSRLQVAWMGGTDLDRFSRYSFDSFENPLHGYPTASIRYNDGAVVRSTTGWTGKGWRVDAFTDLAVVHDPGFGSRLRRYTAIGAAFEAPGPLQSLLSVQWGYGLNAPRPNGGSGTHALRVTAYRIF